MLNLLTYPNVLILAWGLAVGGMIGFVWGVRQMGRELRAAHREEMGCQQCSSHSERSSSSVDPPY
jgi:hypothetical protein